MQKIKRRYDIKGFTNQVISIEIIEKLQLHVPMTRHKRRELSRKAKIDWNTYRQLEFEITRRIRNNLDLETGEPKKNTIKEVEE